MRTQLLSVGLLYPYDQTTQLQGACEAGDHLGLMMRAQVMPPFHEPSLNEVMYRNLDHQILTYPTIGRDEFVSVFDSLEIILEPEAGEIFSVKDVRDGIIDIWEASGGRFIRGNFKRESYADLQRAYPSYALGADVYWTRHINQFPKDTL